MRTIQAQAKYSSTKIGLRQSGIIGRHFIRSLLLLRTVLTDDGLLDMLTASGGL